MAQFKLYRKTEKGWREIGAYPSVKSLKEAAAYYKKHDLMWGAFSAERGLSTRFYIEAEREE